jgi:hypothetical protein
VLERVSELADNFAIEQNQDMTRKTLFSKVHGYVTVAESSADSYKCEVEEGGITKVVTINKD